MATKERPIDRGTRRARALCLTFGDELRQARVGCGLSQAAVGDAVHLSNVHVSRIERGLVRSLSIYHACRLAAVVGLELAVKAYPSGTPIRDAAHRALLDRAREKLACPGSWHYEVPLSLPSDRRAWDCVIALGPGRVALEAETHINDIQALQRRIALKLRDDPAIDRAIIVAADTRHNRAVLKGHRDGLKADFPAGWEILLPCLAQGRIPPANGIILI